MKKNILLSVSISNVLMTVIVYFQFHGELNVVASYVISFIYYGLAICAVIFFVQKLYLIFNRIDIFRSLFLKKEVELGSYVLAVLMTIYSSIFTIVNDLIILFSWLIMLSLSFIIFNRITAFKEGIPPSSTKKKI
jgi:hypothetical protein